VVAFILSLPYALLTLGIYVISFLVVIELVYWFGSRTFSAGSFLFHTVNSLCRKKDPSQV